MFTGIIESQGTIERLEHQQSNLELYIKSELSPLLHIDQSIAHDGVCLTVDQLGPDWHRCTLIKESLNKSNFSFRKTGDHINLERAMKWNARIDGHMVQGHVDASIVCQNRIDENGSWVFEFELPQIYKSLIIPKGSICLNGVSLTVSSLSVFSFEVSIIPYTYDHTNLGSIQIGDPVNVEFDVLGKYIQRHLDMQST